MKQYNCLRYPSSGSTILGGYLTTTPSAIAALIVGYRTGRLRAVDVRVWVALLEIAHRRRPTPGFQIRPGELKTLLGSEPRPGWASRLESVGLLVRTPVGPGGESSLLRLARVAPGEAREWRQRACPIPRRLLRRVLARMPARALCASLSALSILSVMRGRTCKVAGWLSHSAVARFVGCRLATVRRAVDVCVRAIDTILPRVSILCKKKRINKTKPQTRSENPPCGRTPAGLKNVTAEDLRNPIRLRGLWREACSLPNRLSNGTRASFAGMAAAAHKALRVGKNPGAMFAAMLRKRLFDWVAEEDEQAGWAVCKAMEESLYVPRHAADRRDRDAEDQRNKGFDVPERPYECSDPGLLAQVLNLGMTSGIWMGPERLGWDRVRYAQAMSAVRRVNPGSRLLGMLQPKRSAR